MAGFGTDHLASSNYGYPKRGYGVAHLIGKREAEADPALLHAAAQNTAAPYAHPNGAYAVVYQSPATPFSISTGRKMQKREAEASPALLYNPYIAAPQGLAYSDNLSPQNPFVAQREGAQLPN